MTSAIGDHVLGRFAAERVTDAPSVEALVAEYSALLYRVAFSVVRNTAEAEDVVQETFLRVLQHKDGLAAIENMRTWLVRIAWNLALDRRRKFSPEQMEDAVAAQLGSRDQPADEALADAARLAEVFRVIDALPTNERHVLLLSVIEESSTADIAAVLGKSESSVRSLLHRARGHINERMAAKKSMGEPV